MPLQGDQRALLQLLSERGQSYEDIAGLLGGTADDVHERARVALSELGGADPDAEVGLTDYLLGQADPIGRADAVRHLQSDPDALELANRIATSLREIAPEAKVPKLPEPRGKRRRAASAPAGEGSTEAPARTGSSGRVEALARRDRDGSGSGGRQTALLAGLAAAAVILLVAILALAGVFSGDDSTDSTTPPVAGTTDPVDPADPADPTTPANANITTVELAATGDSGVAGTAEFGVVDASQLYVDIDVDGLDPKAPRSSAHFLWLMVGGQAGYPLNTPLTPDRNGGFSGRLPVSAAVASTVAGQATDVKLSLSNIQELADAARNAAEEQVPVVPFTGTELASGRIPLAAPENG